MRRALTIAVIAAAATLAATLYFCPTLRHPLVLYTLWRLPMPPRVCIPVAGVSEASLTDTWGAARTEGRRHEGIDIFAPRGTAVTSATPGIVLIVGTNRLGGRVVEVLGPGLVMHYYAHLDRYAAIRSGQVVHAGDALGYVGDSGNAKGTPCHLHYGMYVPPHHAIDPYIFLKNVAGG
jgi:murein DD-endopeptidase MepM/ murein hydrolase activator NlpD